MFPNDGRIDAIARLLASQHSRRQAVRAGAAGLATALGPLGASAAAQEATPAATPVMITDPHPGADTPAQTEYLFVQPFAGGSWTRKAGEDGVYALTLTGAPVETVYFSDRPERIFGLTTTQKFLDNLGFTPANPPNAALVAQRDDNGEQEVLVIELLNPVYDAAAALLTYDARALADYSGDGLAHAARQQSDYTLPETFAEGGLFIDNFPDCPNIDLNCVGQNSGKVYGSISVGTCSNKLFAPCGYCYDPQGKCAQEFPNECRYQFRNDQGDVIGVGYLCDAKLPGGAPPM